MFDAAHRVQKHPEVGDRPAEVQVFPGMHVKPGVTTWNVAAMIAPDGERIVRLTVEHETGSNHFFLPPDLAKAIADNMVTAATGIQVARQVS